MRLLLSSICILGPILLGGCVSTAISDQGNGLYLAKASASSEWASPDEVATKNYAAAEYFCRSEQKQMNFISITADQKPTDTGSDSQRYSYLSFSCATPKTPFFSFFN